MSRFIPWRRALTSAVLLLPLAGTLAAAQAGQAVAANPTQVRSDHHHQAPACTQNAATPTVEEQRLITPLADGHPSVGAQILAASGLAAFTDDFARALCRADSLATARKLVRRQGAALWNLAVARAQGRVRVPGTLAGNDDRPLYWARLSMTLALRRWTPPFRLGSDDRAALQHDLELSTRGMTSADFRSRPSSRGSRGSHQGSAARVHRVFISSFDPFFLDVDARQGNPSGAAALALDGRVWTARDGETFEVQAVVFPVRYADFDQGLAEEVYRPVFTPGTSRSADMYATVSQGRPGVFDVELYNGRRRSTTAPDNLNEQGGGTFTSPVVFPNVAPGPEFVPTTLPVAQIFMGARGPYPVRLHSSVVEMPTGNGAPVTEAHGPTPGAVAVEGGGGGYLSNEIAYRASLLRDLVGSHVYGGHIHTPVLDFGPDNHGALTDPTFEHNRTAMIDELRSMIESMVLR